MRYLLVKNWRDHQHYTKRSPPWIKLHRAILNDYQFISLSDAAKAHLILIWVLAAGDEGRVPYDEKFVAARIGAARVDLEAFISAGFLIVQGEEDAQPEPTNVALPKRTNGHALDINELPEAWRVFCLNERPKLDPEQTFFQFRDHWMANANQAKGKKADWFAAWRTWIRRERQ